MLKKVIRFYGSSVDVFSFDRSISHPKVFSYQESGTLHSYKRDKAAAAIFQTNDIQTISNRRVIRGIKNRKGWDEAWQKAMESPQHSIQGSSKQRPICDEHPFVFPLDFLKEVSGQRPKERARRSSSVKANFFRAKIFRVLASFFGMG